jgi:hypothetical protein
MTFLGPAFFAEKIDRLEAERDAAYRGRALAAVALAHAALALGLRAGVRIDPDQTPEWRHVLMVELPAGQVSWHIAEADVPLLVGLPDYQEWDGHTPAQRDERLAAPGFKERGSVHHR